MYRGMPPSAGACQTTEAALKPDWGRASNWSSIMTATGWRLATSGVTSRPVSGAATRAGVGIGVGVGEAVGVGVGLGVGVGVAGGGGAWLAVVAAVGLGVATGVGLGADEASAIGDGDGLAVRATAASVPTLPTATI